MKNFESIPKSQIFTREQLKAIRGGDDTTYYGDAKACLSSSFQCHFPGPDNVDVYGRCETNSNNQCVCNAFTASYPWKACVGYS